MYYYLLGSLGMLKDEHDGSILKASYKPLCGVREIQFYENLKLAREPHLVMLKQLVPEYRGTVQMQMGERRVSW